MAQWGDSLSQSFIRPWVDRVTCHSFTASSFQTSSTSATGLMLGIIMLHPPLTPAFLFLLSHLASLSFSLSVCMPPYLYHPLIRRPLQNGALYWRWLCEICRLRLDLFCVIPQTESNPAGLVSLCVSTLLTLHCCCWFSLQNQDSESTAMTHSSRAPHFVFVQECVCTKSTIFTF